MKKITRFLQLTAVLTALLWSNQAAAQCSASFTWSPGSNGQINFGSTSTLASSVSTTYYWSFGNGSPTFTATGTAGMFPTATYSANGTYTVNLFILSSSPTCSSGISGVITVTNAGGCGLNANFSSSNGTPGQKNFNNTSTGTVPGTTYFWNFAGLGTSTQTNPSFTFPSNGNYLVTLVANNNSSPACIDSVQINVIVSNICNMVANFTHSNGSNGNVNFTNTSSGTSGSTYYTWNFGDASPVSHVQNPSHTYANGTYWVLLTIANSSTSPTCQDTVLQSVTVTNASTCNLNANFGYTTGINGQAIFMNTSTGTGSTTSYLWNFAGLGSSTLPNPTFTFSSSGTYTVTLLVSNNSNPACVDSVQLNVIISGICNLNANFTSSNGSNGNVNFTNTSTGTSGSTFYTWNFGDSSPVSHVQNPSHTYANGTYWVLLTIANSSVAPTCIDTVLHSVTVTNNTCIANASFTLVPTATPQFWNAIPATTANIAAAQWSWGDGNTSNTLFTSHTYSAAGNYTICLSVTLTCGASATWCSLYNIYKGASGQMVEVNVVPDASSVGVQEMNVLQNALSVFPNPSNGAFSLNLNGITNETLIVEVHNLVGQVVYSSVEEPVDGTLTKDIDLSNAQTGIYFVKVKQGSVSATTRISVQK